MLLCVKAFAGVKVKYRDKAAMFNGHFSTRLPLREYAPAAFGARACLFRSTRLPLREYAPAASFSRGRMTVVTVVTSVTCDLKVFFV